MSTDDERHEDNKRQGDNGGHERHRDSEGHLDNERGRDSQSKTRAGWGERSTNDG